MDLGFVCGNSGCSVACTQRAQVETLVDSGVTDEALTLFCEFVASMAGSSANMNADIAGSGRPRGEMRRSERLRFRGNFPATSLEETHAAAPSSPAPPLPQFTSKKVQPMNSMCKSSLQLHVPYPL